jgi:hypothetical protein
MIFVVHFFYFPKRIPFFIWCIEGGRRFNFDRLCGRCGSMNFCCYNFCNILTDYIKFFIPLYVYTTNE